MMESADVTMIDFPRSTVANGIAYHQTGAGAPIVLIHGVGLRAESWHAQIDELRRDFEVFAVDLPGHGASQRLNSEEPTLAHFTQAIAGFIVSKIGRPVVIAGHSMGAMIALDMAARHLGHCVGFAALNAIYRRGANARHAVRRRAAQLAGCGDRINQSQDFATSPITRWFGADPSGLNKVAATRCHQWLMHTDRKGYGAAYSVFADEDGPSDAALNQLSVPALFLTGESDENSTPAMSTAMAEKVAQGTIVSVRGAGHMAQMTHACEINTALRELLSAIPQYNGAWVIPSDGG